MPVRCEEGGSLWQLVEAAKDDQPAASDEAPPAAGILAVAQYGPLYDAVWAKCQELVPGNTGSSIQSGLYRADGRGCSGIVERFNNDGTGTVWHVGAYAHIDGRRPRISVQVHGPWTDNSDDLWEKNIADLAKGRDNVVIENHCWFTVGDEGASGMRGFGGHRFEFRPLDGGLLLVSTNMWFGGAIPPVFRDRIPDTHKMLKGFYPGPVE
jgi:hypothetical protein